MKNHTKSIANNRRGVHHTSDVGIDAHIDPKNQKGITLIALVITIIVLLILAGVALSLVMGENGITERAVNAGKTQNMASAKDQFELEVANFGSDFYQAKYVNGSLPDNVDTIQKYIVYRLANVTSIGDYSLSTSGTSATLTATKGSDRTTATAEIDSNGKVIWGGTTIASASVDNGVENDDLQKLRNYFVGKDYTVWYDSDNDNYGTLDGLPISWPDDEVGYTYSGYGDIITYNNNYYELIYANNDYDDVIENVVAYNPDDNWVIAWAYDGTDWSLPYSRDEHLLDSYLTEDALSNILSNNLSYLINDVSELDNATMLAFLYSNGDDTYRLVFVGNGVIEGRNVSCSGYHPWTGGYSNSDGGTWAEIFGGFVSDFKITRLEIREGITGIGNGVFSNMRDLEYVYIPNSVEVIMGDAFSYVGTNVHDNNWNYLTQIEFGDEFDGIFLDGNGKAPSDPDYLGYSSAFFECGWACQYAYDHPESVVDNYFVIIPINGVDWKFMWWFD